jgi:hypothetical protein
MPKTATKRPLSPVERAVERQKMLALLGYQSRALSQGKALWNAGKGLVNEGLGSLISGAEYAGDRSVTKDVPKDINRLGKMVAQNAGGYADAGNALWQMVKGDGKQAVPDYYRNKAGNAYQEQFNPSPADPRLERFGNFYADPLAVGVGAKRAVKAVVDPKLWSGIAEDMARGTRSNIFAGINARNAPKGALEQGAKLLDEGADPRQVWSDLGVFRGTDGKMRWEIDDSASVMSPDSVDQLRAKNGVRQGDIFDHPDLYAAYPESSNIWTAKQGGASSGAYSPGVMGESDMVSLAVPARGKIDQSSLRSTNVHELQHGIQGVEGFAQGGSIQPVIKNSREEWVSFNKARAGNKDLSDAYDKAKGLPPSAPEWDELEDVADNFGLYDFVQTQRIASSGTSPFDSYRRLAGEAEARATQARLGMNAEQRRAVYPFDSYDVPVNELIHANGNGAAMSVQPSGLLGKMVAPQDEALRVAQANAAKPVEEGGLGLRPDNTPEERAAAMGFVREYPTSSRQKPEDMPLGVFYHGTNKPITEFSTSRIGNANDQFLGDYTTERYGTFMAENPEFSATFSTNDGKVGANIMPLMYRSEKPAYLNSSDFYDEIKPQLLGAGYSESGINYTSQNPETIWESFDGNDKLFNTLRNNGYDSADMVEPWADGSGGLADVRMVLDPRNIRSRFAAFDPMRRDSPDLLAGIAPFGAIPWLRNEQP